MYVSVISLSARLALQTPADDFFDSLPSDKLNSTELALRRVLVQTLKAWCEVQQRHLGAQRTLRRVFVPVVPPLLVG